MEEEWIEIKKEKKEKRKKEKKKEEKIEETHPDFSEEYLRHKVRIKTYNGEIVGIVLDGRKYFLKVVTENGKVYYVNKALVEYVEFIE